MITRIAWPAWLMGALVFAPTPASAEEKTYEVETIRNVAYYDGKDADKVRHKLDIYVPKGVKNYPVLFFVHGGAWMMGDKNQFGIYGAIGKNFARHGIGAVLTNYRLSPKVKHPEHIKDVAKAVAWTQRNIKKHGGDPSRVFTCGHSAGGHLVALLATNPLYLKNEGLTVKAIRGVIPMSGVYQIPGKMLPKVFGEDPKMRRDASPLQHVRAGLPPFLVIYADGDMPRCDRMSEKFCVALQGKKCQAKTLEIEKRNHVTIIILTAGADDPAAVAIRKFILGK